MRTPAAIRCGEPAKTSPRTEPATARTRNPSAPRWTRTRVEVFRLRRARAETARESATTKAGSLAAREAGFGHGLAAPRQENLTGDHESLDLRRALVDLEELRVPH